MNKASLQVEGRQLQFNLERDGLRQVKIPQVHYTAFNPDVKGTDQSAQ